jgi:DNA-directed RNA polymerase subunit RPC12/RpoP
MTENLKCNVCGGELTEDDLALLKVRKKLVCKYCKNLIVLDEKTSTIKEDLCCMICGGALTAEDLTQKDLACRYCANAIEEISYSEANYPEIFERLK